MKIEHVLKLIHYFRMSKHARNHLEKDDPRTPPCMEEEDASPTHNDLTYRIEEAMEEEADMSSTGRGGEGDAGSNASSLCRLPRGEGTPMDIPSAKEDQHTRPDQDEVVGGNTTSPGGAELGEVVGGNTTEPIDIDMEVNLMEKLELGSSVDKERRKHDIQLVFLSEEMNRATSPATSTPSSTPSPRRYREGGIEGLGTEDSDVSDIVDSSVAETEEPEDKRGVSKETLLDGKSKEGNEPQGTADLPGKRQSKKKGRSIDEEPRSSISQRTRARTGVKRKAEVSAFMEEGDSSMTSMRTEAGSMLAETLSFSEDPVWLGEGKWMRTMERLDETVERIDAALEESEGVLKAVESINEPEVVDITGENVVKRNRKKVTFKVDYEDNNLAIEEVVELLEVVSKAGVENAPRTQIERIIRILVAICIDIYGRMQYAQRTIGTTASLLQEYMEKAEEMEEMKKNEDKLKEEIESLKQQRADLEGFRNRMVEYLSDSRKNEVWNVVTMKHENTKLQNEIKKLDDMFRKKVAEYDLFFNKNAEKKARIETLEEEFKKERQQSKAEENRLRKKLDRERAKTEAEKARAEEEKEARIKELTEKNELIIEKNDIKDRLDIAEAHWSALKVDLNTMDTEWDRTRKDLQKTVKELREENSLLRDEMSNKDKEKKTEVQLKETKIKKLEQDIEIRAGNTKSLITDLRNRQKEVDDLKKTVMEMGETADRSDNKIKELRKEVKEMKAREERAKAQIKPPVTEQEKSGTLLAAHEKPLQENIMIEEGESDISHSYMSAEEGASADLDSTFKKPEQRPRRVEKKKSSRERRESSSDESSQSGSRKRDRQGRRKDSETSQGGEKETVDSLREEIRKMKDEKRIQDREMKEMKEIKEELERSMTENVMGTPSKGKKSVMIINITDENRDRVSTLLGGLLDNGNGTYSRTPMSETWKNNKEIQLINRYDSAPPRPTFLDNIPEHPNPSIIDAEWSFKGEWRDAPREANGTGARGTETRVARIEPYVDYDGRIKKAICYGGKMGELKIWFDFEEVKKVFPNWDTSQESVYYNNKTYSGTLKREYLEEKKGKRPSRDQSKDIQEGGDKGKGKRGGYSGGATGYSRGNFHNRGGGGKRSEAREREYKEWDDWQSAGASRGGRSQDEMSEMSTYSEPQGRRRRNESPGYTTKKFSEARRRNWSPNPDRNNRRGRSLERHRDNRDHYNERRDQCSGCDSRDYSSDRNERRELSPNRYGRRDQSPRQRGRQERYGDRTKDRKEYSSNEGRGYSGHR